MFCRAGDDIIGVLCDWDPARAKERLGNIAYIFIDPQDLKVRQEELNDDRGDEERIREYREWSGPVEVEVEVCE